MLVVLLALGLAFALIALLGMRANDLLERVKRLEDPKESR
jgi:predicted lysophospholipase L1 biosynthesis ABC-type transport system permease subunit